MGERLREIPNIRQIKNEPRRRWFTSELFDLTVWVNGANRLIGFQFSHRSGNSEHAFTWHVERGWDYTEVDTGKPEGFGMKATPILRANGAPNFVLLRKLFKGTAGGLPVTIQRFVINRFTPQRPEDNASKTGQLYLAKNNRGQTTV